MAKSTGLGDQCYVADSDLSGDIGSLGSIHNARAATDVTAIDKSATERLLLAKDGGIDFTAWFNPANAHLELNDLPTVNTLVSYYRGTVLGNVAASMVGKQINYDPSRGADGSLSFAVQAQSDGYGLEWGRMLTAGKVTAASAGAQSGLDYGATIGATNFGLQAYLHAFSIGSGTATVAIQDSDDNGVDPWTNVGGAVFTNVTAAGWERIATGSTENVKRWLRVNVTGTFTNLVFAVMVVKNETAVAF